jgi:hypothetical protein
MLQKQDVTNSVLWKKAKLKSLRNFVSKLGEERTIVKADLE